MTSWMTSIWWHASKLNHRGSNGAVTKVEFGAADVNVSAVAHKGLNNRVEGSHRPTRKREKIMGRFKSPRHAQRFLYAHDQANILFKPRRYKMTAAHYRQTRSDASDLWNAYDAQMTA